MTSGTPYIGTKISLISKSEIRYEGILYAIDTKEATVTLASVRSLGTEDREVEKYIAPRNEKYEFIVFRGQDIKDLTVGEPKREEQMNSQPPQDPAIVQTGLPSGYSHFHTPVSYPHVPSYGPFGGVPSYGGYPPGIPQRPMPGHIQPPMGMMPPPAVMPQRIGTPPAIPTMPLSRGHSPSPDSVLPGSSSTKSAESQGNESHSRTTSQQGTQTVQTKKKPSSRPSSRRNSEDKTEQPLESKKKPEVKKEEKETTSSKEATGGNQTQAEPQKQRQGGNRRTQGRRGNSSTRGSKPKPGGGPVKFEGEFDFESSNAKFNKEEIEEELQQKLHENLRITDEVENKGNSSSNSEDLQDKPQTPTSFYDSSKSFFDSISCEANDRDRNRRAHPSWQQERKVNMETFGAAGGMRRGGRGRGRGRGGYRGGRGGYRYQGRDNSSRGGRGGYRGGSRGGRTRAWVDYPIDGDEKLLPKNLANGPSMVGDAEAAAKA